MVLQSDSSTKLVFRRKRSQLKSHSVFTSVSIYIVYECVGVGKTRRSTGGGFSDWWRFIPHSQTMYALRWAVS